MFKQKKGPAYLFDYAAVLSDNHLRAVKVLEKKPDWQTVGYLMSAVVTDLLPCSVTYRILQ